PAGRTWGDLSMTQPLPMCQRTPLADGLPAVETVVTNMAQKSGKGQTFGVARIMRHSHKALAKISPGPVDPARHSWEESRVHDRRGSELPTDMFSQLIYFTQTLTFNQLRFVGSATWGSGDLVRGFSDSGVRSARKVRISIWKLSPRATRQPKRAS